MFQLSRRTFIVTGLSAPILPAVAVGSTVMIPILRGDGIHDDTKAVTALFSGKPLHLTSNPTFRVARLENGSVTLIGGTFRVHKNVAKIAREDNHVISQVKWIAYD